MAAAKDIVESKKILVDLEKCISCKACVAECPMKLYYFKNEKLLLSKYADGLCMECGHCVAVCPSNAIILKELNLRDVKEITEDMKKISYKDVMNIIQTRRTIRQYKDEALSEDLWDNIIEAARYSPTGHNDQLVHITIIRRPENSKFSDEITKNIKEFIKVYEDPNKKDQLDSLYSKELMKMMKGWLPIFKTILQAYDRGQDFWCWNGELMIFHGPKYVMNIVQDSSLAAAHVMLAAEALGLGTCSLGLIVMAINHFKSVAEFIQFPKNHIVGYVMAIGFPKVKYYRIPARQPAKITWI
jgi:nitroreductase/NAD-dependent dihydropyrimidine dehydrogenase PreA subunit